MATTIGPGRRIIIGREISLKQGTLRDRLPDHTHDPTVPGSGGTIVTTGAPTDAEYLVGAANVTLTAERVVTDTATVTWDLTTPGQAKANAVGGYTDEQAQDAVGTILTDTTSFDFTYDDATPKITADVKFAGATPADVAGTAAVGTGATPSHEDHAHEGVHSVNGQTGDVTIGGTGGGAVSPGRVNDPNTILWTHDDFTTGSTETGEIGETGWANGGNVPSVATTVAGHPGLITITSTGAGALRDIREREGTVGSWSSDDFFDVIMKFRLNQDDGNTIAAVGVLDNAGTEPANGIKFEKQAADTNWFFVTRDSIGALQARTDSTESVTAGEWVSIRIRRIDANTVGGSIAVGGGAYGTEITHTTHIPAATAMNRSFQIKSASGTKTMDCDYADLLITGLTR